MGEHAGPRLWRVSKGEHVVWVLGTLDPLPKRMTWRSHEVEEVVRQAQEVLPSVVSVSADIGPVSAIRLYLQYRRTEKVPRNASLRDALPPPLYARLVALQARFAPRDSRLLQLRPLFAARRLYDDALDASHLTSRNDIQQSVLAMARRQGVPIHRNKVRIEDPRALLTQVGGLPAAAEVECLDATVSRLESDLAAMQERARAWAVGDMTTLRTLSFPDQRQVCLAAIMNAPAVRTLIDRAQADWAVAFDEALERNAVTLAMRPVGDLLGPAGVLASLRARGYGVEGP